MAHRESLPFSLAQNIKLGMVEGQFVKNGAYRNPEGRMAMFLENMVDRGPGQVEVINIVRNMIEAGSAVSPAPTFWSDVE